MPWKEVTAVNERMERKTGYKFEQHYEEHGPKGCMTFPVGPGGWRASYRREFKRRFWN